MGGITPDLTLEFSPTSGPFGTPAWVDITDYWMREATVSRGRQSELAQFSPGRLSVTLNNSDRRFDPNHSTGPYYGNLRPRRPIRLSAVYGPVLVDSNGVQWMVSVSTSGALTTTQVAGKTPSPTIILST